MQTSTPTAARRRQMIGDLLAGGLDGGGAPVVVLLSTYDEDQLDASDCGAAAYIPKVAFGPERLSAEWHGARRVTGAD